MAKIVQTNGRPVIDYMARDFDSLLQAMRDLVPSRLPEWTDYANEADFGNVLLELFAHMGDILSYYQDRVANESFLGTAQSRRSIIQHLRLIGYDLATAAPASALLTLLVPVPAGSDPVVLTIPQGAAFATKSLHDQPSIRFEYTGEVSLEIDCRALPTTKDPARPGLQYWRFGPDPFDPALADAPGGVPVEEGRLIANERLGTSDGTPNQRYPLAQPRLILRPIGQGQSRSQDLVLLVEYGSTVERWNRRESLAFSRTGTLSGELEAEHDFVVEVDEDDRSTVIFGDGEFGAIPPRDAVIKATYRTGGGVGGNVPSRAITTIVNAPPLALVGAKIMNVKRATGGAERESIEHAVLQAPSVFRARKRAVTQDDYEALARSFRGVGKVRAEATYWNSVTLYVAPEGGGQVSDVLRGNLLAYFEDKRPITTRIEVAGADYVPIYITVRIETESYYDPENVKARVLAAAGQILAFDNVDFGQTLYLSKFYEAIESVEGVRDVFISQFTRDSTRPDEIETNGQIKLGPNDIPQLSEAGIRVVAV